MLSPSISNWITRQTVAVRYVGHPEKVASSREKGIDRYLSNRDKRRTLASRIFLSSLEVHDNRSLNTCRYNNPFNRDSV